LFAASVIGADSALAQMDRLGSREATGCPHVC
jgi:hypothetical protein